MSIELKPCPFCGGSAWTEEYPVKDGPSTFSAYCERCGAETSLSYKSREEAAEAWNTRAERMCRKLPSSGEKECTVTHAGTGLSMNFGYWKCSECGCECFEGARYCMGCGAKVADE